MIQRVLVTGAGGFLGARLVASFGREDGIAVTGTYRTGPCPLVGADSGIQCDLSQSGAADRLFADRRIDTVVHAAAALVRGNDSTAVHRAVQDNIVAHANLLSAAVAHGCQRFVFCSTISVYEGASPRDSDGWREDDPVRPDSVYGWSKAAGEELLRLAAVEAPALGAVSLRLAGIHGPGKTGGIVYNAVRAALSDEPLKINDRNSRFRLVFVDDAVAAVKSAIANGPRNGYDCYNVAGEEIFTLPQLAKACGPHIGSELAIDVQAGTKTRDRVMDITKIKKELSYQPIGLDQNLANTFAWLRDTSAREG